MSSHVLTLFIWFFSFDVLVRVRISVLRGFLATLILLERERERDVVSMTCIYIVTTTKVYN